MNEIRRYKALCSLLKVGLWEIPAWEEGVFPLEASEWKALYQMAGKQAVVGVVFDGIRKLPKEWAPSPDILARWLLAVNRIAQEHARIGRTMQEQARVWKSRGLEAVLLKGPAVARMYGFPEHRMSGDIDWYFPKQQEWSRAWKVAEEWEAKPERDSDGDMHYLFQGTLVEHHRCWEHLSAPWARKRLRCLEKEEGYAEWQGVKVLSPLTDLLQLNTHILKHALVLGVGWRQLCDLAMAYRFYEGKYDTEKLKENLDRLGLMKWTGLLHAALVETIGMPERYLPFPLKKGQDPQPLIQQIARNGNFGLHRDHQEAYQQKSRWEKLKYLVEGMPEKIRLFGKYAPGELCWRPMGLLVNRLKRCFPNEWGRQMAWVGRMFRPYRKKILYSACIDLLGMGLSLVSIYFSKRAIDIATGTQEGELWMNAAAMVVCILGNMLAGIYTSWISEKVWLKSLVRLQNLLNERLMAASWIEAQKWHTGDILNRLTTDCAEVVMLMVYTLPSVVVTLIKLVASFGFLCMLDVRIAWILLASTPFLLLSKLYYRKMRKLSQEWKMCDSRIVAVMQENMSSRLLIGSLGAEGVRRTLLEEEQENRYRVGMEQLKFGTYSKGVLRSVFNGGYFIAFLFGIYYLSQKWITFGTMIAFIQLVGRVQGPVLQLIGFVPGLIKVRASVERMMELDECGSGRQRTQNRLEKVEALELRNVHFGYDQRKVLEAMDLTVLPGEPLAVMGPTGVGKTTLVRLVAGILEPEAGRIVLRKGENEWDCAGLDRLNFVYVPQGNTLFSGTVRENLQMVDRTVSEERIKEVLQMACADFVWKLPEGLDTKIGESGFGLSEGQAQRLSVARAMLLPGKVWILDEVTSALDAVTAERLIGNLLEVGKDKIMIFVTHDATLKDRCAHAIYLDRA